MQEVESWEEYEGLLVGFWLNIYGDGETEYPVYPPRPEVEKAAPKNPITVTFDGDDLHEALQAAAERYGMEFVELNDAFKARIAEDIVASILDEERWAEEGVNAEVYTDFVKR